MNLRILARKNVAGNAQRYAAYFLSCVFTVMICFIYAQFIFHPEVRDGELHDAIRNGMIAAQFIIVLFAIFFINYSNSVFLQARSKEFGLLTLFGMNKRQIRSLVYYEQTIISLIAIICGLLLGTLFSKLFLMFMSSLLTVDTTIEFQIVPIAYLVTGGGFLLLFQLLSLVSFWKLRKQKVIDLLKEANKPKEMPKTSVWLTILAILCLGVGYSIAVMTNMMIVALTMLPVTGLVVLGTYFFFTQGTVALYKTLYANKKNLYSGTTIINRTNTLFRLKDYARMLFITSVISAVVLTASGTVYMFFNAVINDGVANMPFTYSWIEDDPDEQTVIDPNRVEQLIGEHDAELLFKLDEVLIPASLEADLELGYGFRSYMMPESAFNKYSSQLDLDSVSLANDEIAIITNDTNQFFSIADSKEGLEEGSVTVKLGEEETSYNAVSVQEGIVTEGFRTIVLSDDAFSNVLTHREADPIRLIGYELNNWQNEKELSEALDEAAGMSYMNNKPLQYLMLMQMYSLVLFIGLFVSIIFFIVQGSMLYLKLFTDMADTKKQLFALNRIGLTKKEQHRILDGQMRFLFFVPVIVGSIHASFAYIMLSNVLQTNLVMNAILVISIYVVLQTIYYLVTRLLYFRAVMK